MPMVQALAVAINSGLVTYPTRFQKLGYAKGLAIWEPIPPKGYVALGHVASAEEDGPAVQQVCHLR